jgi:hypothetical protein
MAPIIVQHDHNKPKRWKPWFGQKQQSIKLVVVIGMVLEVQDIVI